MLPMKTLLYAKAALILGLATLTVPPRSAAADNLVDAIDMVRATYQADRQTFVQESLELTADEGAAFWPLYQNYRSDMEKLGDSLVKLVLEYSDAYPNVPEERARQLLKEYTALEKKLVNKRSWYVQRATRVLPVVKALRWAQIENRMDLVLRLQLAGTIPPLPPP